MQGLGLLGAALHARQPSGPQRKDQPPGRPTDTRQKPFAPLSGGAAPAASFSPPPPAPAMQQFSPGGFMGPAPGMSPGPSPGGFMGPAPGGPPVGMQPGPQPGGLQFEMPQEIPPELLMRLLSMMR